MKSFFTKAATITAAALGIGAVAHTYGTSYEELCDASFGSNSFTNFVADLTGHYQNAGRWVSPARSAVCDSIGVVEGPVVRFFTTTPLFTR